MYELYKQIADAALRHGGWVDIDLICQELRIDRKTLNYHLNDMKAKFDFFKKKTKRTNLPARSFSPKVSYEIKVKVDAESYQQFLSTM